MSLWQSREALDVYRTTIPTTLAALLFRAVEVQPTLSLFKVNGQ